MTHQIYSNTAQPKLDLLLGYFFQLLPAGPLPSSASYDWELRTRDILQAFVSSEFDLFREVYIVPPKEVGRPKDELWRLLKPLYGLPESSLLWYATYAGHLCSSVAMTCDPVDPCLFYRF